MTGGHPHWMAVTVTPANVTICSLNIRQGEIFGLLPAATDPVAAAADATFIVACR